MDNNELQLLGKWARTVYVYAWLVLTRCTTEAVELRLAVAETDAQLEKNVGNFLVPVLLKMSSTSDIVRKKVCLAGDSFCDNYASIYR